MIFKAILSNKAHPELGQATIPFPIPDNEYDHTIALLEDMGVGSPTAQACRVDEVDSTYPILNRLTAQSVNVDELDYLAKRLDSFCADENAQFQAMAEKLDLTDIRDFINLTFCCCRCQRRYEIVRKRRRNFVVFRRGGGNKNQVLPCSKRVFTICCFWRINSLRSFRR